MLGLGIGEFVVLAVVLIIAVGPKAMPDFFKTVGRGLRQFRQATRELRVQTGIDDILRDQPARRAYTPPKPRQPVEVTDADRRREFPADGVDIFHIRAMGDTEEAPPSEGNQPEAAGAPSPDPNGKAPPTPVGGATGGGGSA